MKNENLKKARDAEIKIIEVLSDGKWHRAQDLRVEAHMSSKTLYKNLEKFKPYLEEYEDRESGKYPYPKYYRANELLMEIVKLVERTSSMWKSIEERFLETKDLAFALEQINAMDNLSMIFALSRFKDVKPSPEIIEDLLFLFNWRGHETLTKKLALTCLEDIDSIDLERTLERLVLTKEGQEAIENARKEKKKMNTEKENPYTRF